MVLTPSSSPPQQPRQPPNSVERFSDPLPIGHEMDFCFAWCLSVILINTVEAKCNSLLTGDKPLFLLRVNAT